MKMMMIMVIILMFDDDNAQKSSTTMTLRSKYTYFKYYYLVKKDQNNQAYRSNQAQMSPACFLVPYISLVKIIFFGLSFGKFHELVWLRYTWTAPVSSWWQQRLLLAWNRFCSSNQTTCTCGIAPQLRLQSSWVWQAGDVTCKLAKQKKLEKISVFLQQETRESFISKCNMK